MNKKVYIKPTMETMNVETVEMIATSQANKFSVSNGVTNDDAAMSNERRGGWGNLWK